MAEVTAVPNAVLIARQTSGLDLSSLLTAGLSIFSSITSELSLTVSSDPTTTDSGSSATQTPFQTSQTSLSGSAASSTGLASSSGSIQSSVTAPTSQLFGTSTGSSKSTSSASAANLSTSNKSNGGSSDKVPIIVGVVLGIIVLSLLGLLIFLCCRRRRKSGTFFKRSGRTTPSIGDSEVGADPLFAESKEPGEVAAIGHHRYPPTRGAAAIPPLRRHSGENGYMAVNPFEDGNRSPYDRRSRRSLTLDPVNEQPEQDRPISEPRNSYMNRRYSSSSWNGNGFGAPGVPPRSPQRRSIPRKPVPSPDADMNSGFDFGFPRPLSNGNSPNGVGATRYYRGRRTSWQNDSPF